MSSRTPLPAAGEGQSPYQELGLPRPTKEEIEVLRECYRESIMKRSLPVSALCVLGTRALMQKGIIKPQTRAGVVMWHGGAFIFGWIAGRISYSGKCNERLMQLENSALGEMLRRRKEGLRGFRRDYPPGSVGYGSAAGEQQPAYSSSAGSPQQAVQDEYDVARQSSQETVELKGLDETAQPSMDADVVKSVEMEPNQQYTSYADLRNKHRGEHEMKRAAALGPASPRPGSDYRGTQEISQPGSRPVHSTPSSSSVTETATPYVRRNKYGDIIEE